MNQGPTDVFWILIIACVALFFSIGAVFAYPYVSAEALADVVNATTDKAALREQIIAYNLRMIPIRLTIICLLILGVIALSVVHLVRSRNRPMEIPK